MIVRPFPALRPRPDVAARIAAPPYDVVTTDEARQVAAGEPLSFLHVSRAEIDLPAGTSPYDAAVYAKASENFTSLKAFMVEETDPAFYLYRLAVGTEAQVGLAACQSVDQYLAGDIKKHELTHPDKEDDRTRHLVALRAQTGPVLLVYRHLAAIDGLINQACARQPLYDFRAPDAVQHTIWKVGSPAEIAALASAFDRVPAMYIADGHHRAAAAARAHAQLASASRREEAEHPWFLAVAFPDDQVRILPYNRIVTDLAGMTPERFLGAIHAPFRLRPGSSAPARRGECSMFLAGQWYCLTLGPAGEPPGADPVRALDVALLQHRLLEPVLKVVDPRTDDRINFVGGSWGAGALERAVSSGRAAVAFSMFPVSVDELLAIADAGSIMPPKSTWFEPKLRDGLLTHVI